MKKKNEKKMKLGSIKVAKLNISNEGKGINKDHTIFTTTTHRTYDC
ncbi:hypothetical protein CLV51_102851 [Chitinophaga niastensis]|uniref:Uncharacterized protein n=1 Tax=Chitinophaga niastensis TaxID=536980 RepID=A0A2P8HP51_CHINA|nr:hypothetical protein [Chitinophaga niastensis]PSL47991.1 hypothetical protein CLV51_102851 [Chitinophaga niastensis]